MKPWSRGNLASLVSTASQLTTVTFPGALGLGLRLELELELKLRLLQRFKRWTMLMRLLTVMHEDLSQWAFA